MKYLNSIWENSKKIWKLVKEIVVKFLTNTKIAVILPISIISLLLAGLTMGTISLIILIFTVGDFISQPIKIEQQV